MAKLKAGVSDPTVFFNLDGADYPKKNYQIVYSTVEIDSSGKVNESTLQVGLSNKSDGNFLQIPILVSDWIDSTDTSYSSLTQLLNDFVTIVCFGSGPTSFNYNDATIIYTFRKLYLANTVGNIMIRRDSDNSVTNVFWDGVKITLNSLTNPLNATTPTSTTLGTFLGVNNGFIFSWFQHRLDNTINSTNQILQPVIANQPKMLNAGAFLTKNGENYADFNDDTLRRNISDGFTFMDDGQNFVIFATVFNTITTNAGGTVTSNNANADRFVIFCDRRTQKRHTSIRAGGSSFFADLLVQTDISDLRLLTSIVTGSAKTFSSQLDGVNQDQDIAWTNTYLNTDFVLGESFASNNRLTGGISEIIGWDLDLHPDLDITGVNNDIKTYYSI